MKSPSSFVRQSPTSNISTAGDIIFRNSMEEKPPSHLSTVSYTPEKIRSARQSSSMCTLNRPIYKNCSNEKLRKTSSVGLQRLNTPTTLHPTYQSQLSLNNDNNNKEQ